VVQRLFILVLCLPGLLLPWRARVAYAAALGWALQGVYWLRGALLSIVLKGLGRAARAGSNRNPGEGASG
jgi:hypothetical protein